jgi:hypothetical protein
MQSREREAEVVPCRSVGGNPAYLWKWGPAAPRPHGRLHGGRIAAFLSPCRWWPIHRALRPRPWSTGSLLDGCARHRRRSAPEARPWLVVVRLGGSAR